MTFRLVVPGIRTDSTIREPDGPIKIVGNGNTVVVHLDHASDTITTVTVGGRVVWAADETPRPDGQRIVAGDKPNGLDDLHAEPETETRFHDAEIRAISEVWRALEYLGRNQRLRVLSWARARTQMTGDE